MAEIIGISRGTVDTCMRRVFGKFGTNDRTVACIRAHELRFIHAAGVEAATPRCTTSSGQARRRSARFISWRASSAGMGRPKW